MTDLVVVDFPMPIPLLVERTYTRAVLLSTTLDELLDPGAKRRAYRALVDSVGRQGFTPRGGCWLLCCSVPDDPDWRDAVAPHVAAGIDAVMAGMVEAHLMVYAIADVADVRTADPGLGSDFLG